MQQEEPYAKISPTAKLVAYLRTFTDIPFAKEIAAQCDAEAVFASFAGDSAESLIRRVPVWEARYKASNRIIKARGISQVLEVAAGLSPRGLELTGDPEVVCVATDLPQILEDEQAIALAILKKLNISRPTLHFQTANALDREDVLRAVSIFQPERPLAVVTEGLLPYLTRAEKTALASIIRDVLAACGGMWITPTEGIKQLSERVADTDGGASQVARTITDATDRNLEDNRFTDEHDMELFFNSAGFQVEEYPFTNVVDELSSPQLLNLEGKSVTSLLQWLKTLILTL